MIDVEHVNISLLGGISMASIIKKKIKGKEYFYMVDVQRVDGKPRYTNQKYLGPAEEVIKKLLNSTPSDPLYSEVLDYGDVIALYDLAMRLEVVELINGCVNKREQGLSIGEYMLIAAINRAVAPTAKLKISRWFSKTILSKILPINAKMLSSQRYWDNMGLLDESAMKKFEDLFVKKITETYQIPTSCLIYDATNFFTYIDTANKSTLAQRGHSKEKRKDLKIVGLSMMVTPDFNIPLYYETYSGNKADSKQFNGIIDKLKKRYTAITGRNEDVTIVFDRGNNSKENIELLEQGETPFHYVGGLKLNQCKELLEIPKEDYNSLSGAEFKGATAYRITKEVFKRTVTVVVTYNPELEKGQLQGILANIKKCSEKLNELKTKLEQRAAGKIVKGKRPTVESVTIAVNKILATEYMQDIIMVKITEASDLPSLEFTVHNEKLEAITEKYLGKSILFTDRHQWSNEQIVGAYRSAWHVEAGFRQMKNTDHLSVRPMWHWTDQKINVHIFYCVLAYRLCCILRKELVGKGIDLSINEMLSELSEIKQVVNIYKPENGKEPRTYSMTKRSEIALKIIDELKLDKYKLVR